MTDIIIDAIATILAFLVTTTVVFLIFLILSIPIVFAMEWIFRLNLDRWATMCWFAGVLTVLNMLPVLFKGFSE